MIRNRSRALVIALAAFAVATFASAAAARTDAPDRGQKASASSTITIWTDKDRRAAVGRVAGAWAARRGVTVNVVEKDFGKIRDDLKTVQSETAPDVIVGAHDWTGQLAADGLVVPLFPSKRVLSQIPKYARDAFSYGKTSAKLYGMPVALENVGLFVNTRLARVPKNFADLRSQALKFKRKSSGNLGIAVQQGAGGDAYHMYPFFSGLCGYIFGKTRGGALDANRVGVANPTFLRNSTQIDQWNKEGLINAKIDGDLARDAFIKGRAAFYITGPWNIDTIRKAGIRFTIVQVPAINCRSGPFLGVQGFMVTKFASRHGVLTAAKDLVGAYMATSGSQLRLASANGRYPANTIAGKAVKDSALRQIGRASAGGIPMPNIPEMNAVWSELGGAWVKSTKGAGATKARIAFTTAARNIRNKIASG